MPHNREKTVPSRQEVSLQPPLAQMFAKNLHDASIGRNVIVRGNDFFSGYAVCGFKYFAETVRGRFIRSEYPEVAMVKV